MGRAKWVRPLDGWILADPLLSPYYSHSVFKRALIILIWGEGLI